MNTDRSSPPRRVFLHIGAPKTGTTYLQQRLQHNTKTLAKNGNLLVPGRMFAQHQVALDLRGIPPQPSERNNYAGIWHRVVDRIMGSELDAILSSELLAWATPADVARARAALDGRDIHVVFTARDLGRQVPAIWQEELKNGARISFDAFLERLDDPGNKLGPRQVWMGQDPRICVEKWAAELDPGNVHIVTVPPRGSDPDLLWRRFSAVIGIDPDAYEPFRAESNVGLGVSQADLLQRINASLPVDFPVPVYRWYVKHNVAETSLVATGRDGKVGLPEQHFESVQRRTDEIIAYIESRGFHVTGDLADLRPVPGPPAPEPDEANVARAAVSVIRDLLDHLRKAREREDELKAELGEVTGTGPVPVPAVANEHEPEIDVSTPVRVSNDVPAAAARVDRHDPNKPGSHAVFLYVGTPASPLPGVRPMLWAQARALAGQGVRLAGRNDLEQFYAALDLRHDVDTDPGIRAERDAWEDLARQVRENPGTWLIAHEHFSPLSQEMVDRAIESLAPAAVHLIVTVPDLDQQVGRAWVRYLLYAKGTDSFPLFLDGIVANSTVGRAGAYFWLTEDPLLVLRPWRSRLPAEQLHVVTAPEPETQGFAQLWDRVAGVLGVDPGSIDPEPAPAGEIGVRGGEVLRRLNSALAARGIDEAGYQIWVRDRLAEKVLAPAGENPLRLPAQHRTWYERESRLRVDGLAASGVDVVGDLAELMPSGATFDRGQPADLTVSQGLDDMVSAFADFVIWLEQDRQRRRGLMRRGARAIRERFPALRRW